MKVIGEIKVDADKVITPTGSCPINAHSTVRIAQKPHHEGEKLSAMIEHVAMNVTGGIVPTLPVAADESEIYRQTLQVILVTEGLEYVIADSTTPHGVNEDQFDSLRIAIAGMIGQNHL